MRCASRNSAAVRAACSKADRSANCPSGDSTHSFADCTSCSPLAVAPLGSAFFLNGISLPEDYGIRHAARCCVISYQRERIRLQRTSPVIVGVRPDLAITLVQIMSGRTEPSISCCHSGRYRRRSLVLCMCLRIVSPGGRRRIRIDGKENTNVCDLHHDRCAMPLVLHCSYWRKPRGVYLWLIGSFGPFVHDLQEGLKHEQTAPLAVSDFGVGARAAGVRRANTRDLRLGKRRLWMAPWVRNQAHRRSAPRGGRHTATVPRNANWPTSSERADRGVHRPPF